MTNRNKDALLRQLADRQEITDLIYRYCRAVDRIDTGLGKSIFHDNATADYGDFFKGSGHGVIDAVCTSHRACAGHSHQVTNILFNLQGDLAGTEAYHHAVIRMQVDGSLMQVTVWGRYIDRWSRRAGRWGIDHRLVLRDFDEVREVTPASDSEPSRRDGTCPSYAILPRHV